MNTQTIDWSLFCEKESSRYNLSTPWIKNGIKTATDGMIILIQRVDEPDHDPGEGRRPYIVSLIELCGLGEQLPEGDSILVDTLDTECVHCNNAGFTESMECESCDGGRCGECDGSGIVECHCCGNDDDCEECCGSGKCPDCDGTERCSFRFRYACTQCIENPVDVFDRQLDRCHVRALKTLPGCRVRKSDNGKWCNFAADGGLFGTVGVIVESER